MTQRDGYDLSKQAEEADKAQDYTRAEELWLKAAQTVATSSMRNDVKNRRMWDAAAKRSRRLAQLGAHR